jgi:hypothetical protein
MMMAVVLAEEFFIHAGGYIRRNLTHPNI